MLLFNDKTEYKMNKFLSAALAEKKIVVSILSSRDFENIKSFQPFKLRNEVLLFLTIFRAVPFQYIQICIFIITIKHSTMRMYNKNMV